MRTKRTTLIVYITAIIIASLAYTGILYAQAMADITLNPGQTYIVACAKRLVARRVNRFTWRLECEGNSTVPIPTATDSPTEPPLATSTPIPTIDVPTATKTPTNTPVPPTATNTVVPPTATVGPTPTSLMPTVTNTPVPTVVPTATSTPVGTPTPLPTNTPVAALLGAWHAPTNHSHFDAPQSWVTNWSMAEFGHGVVYGGDENSGPMEMQMKEAVYKGVQATTDAGGQVYLRYHAGSNPLDRSARYHSYELYYRDVAGNISFWQGWFDTGDPNTLARCPRRLPALSCENQRPIILVVDQTAWNNNIRGEQWYMRASPQSSVSWDLGIDIINSTTVYQPGENATAMDQSTWVPTGDKGMRIRSDGFWYLGRGGGGTTLTGWFCSEPLGRITTRGSKTCAVGSLPQYIALTLGADARPDGFGNNRVQWLFERTMATPQGVTITLPN